MTGSGFFAELNRRRVVRVAVVYAAMAWALIQMADTIFPRLGLPDWTVTLVVVLALFGFPVALVLAWAFDVTRDGVKRAPGRPGGSAAARGRGPAFAGLGILVGLVGFGAYAYVSDPREPDPSATISSIAVLPFEDMSPEGDQQYFGDGLAEELLDALAQIDGLRVPARTSAFQFRGQSVDVREIGRKLSVQSVLEGSVRKAGDDVRITAQLIDAETGYHLWSDTFDGRLIDVFALQDSVARAIIDALEIRLPGADARVVDRSTRSSAAHDSYLRARHFLNLGTREDLQRAVASFEEALRVDPEYAPAFAGLATAWGFMADAYVPPHEAYPRAAEAARRALALDESLAEAHTILGLVNLTYAWDWAAGKRELDRALELNPNWALAHFALTNYHSAMGESGAALDAARRALDLDPLSPAMNHFLIWFLLASDEPDAALDQYARLQGLAPGFVYLEDLGGMAYLAKGMPEPALELFLKAEQTLGHPTPGLVLAYADLGRGADAERVLATFEADSAGAYVVPEMIANVHARLGNVDRAFEWLERGVDSRSAAAPFSASVFTGIRRLRSDPRYGTLRERMGLPWLVEVGTPR